MYRNSLPPELQQLLVAVASGAAAISDDHDLIRLGLVNVTPDLRGREISDPILAPLLTPLRVHHISDIHVGPKTAADVDLKEDATAGARFKGIAGPATVRDAYLTELQHLAGRGMAPHMLVISGDVVEFATAEQYAEAKVWLVKVRAIVEATEHPALGGGQRRVLVVGGNHDVSWGLTGPDRPLHERHQAFADAFAGDPHPHLEQPIETRRFEESVVLLREAGVAFLLLGTAEIGGETVINPVRRDLLGLLDKLPTALSDDLRTEVEAARASLGRDAVCERMADILLARKDLGDDVRRQVTKLRDEPQRIDPGFVHGTVLDRIAAFSWPGSTPVRIAVLHHPVTALPAAIEVAAFAGLVNAGRVKATLMRAGFQLVLHGHLHRGSFAIETWPDNAAKPLYIAAAPSLGSREVVEHHGYNEVIVIPGIDEEGKRSPLRFEVTRRVHVGGAWKDEPAVLKVTV